MSNPHSTSRCIPWINYYSCSSRMHLRGRFPPHSPYVSKPQVGKKEPSPPPHCWFGTDGSAVSNASRRREAAGERWGSGDGCPGWAPPPLPARHGGVPPAPAPGEEDARGGRAGSWALLPPQAPGRRHGARRTPHSHSGRAAANRTTAPGTHRDPAGPDVRMRREGYRASSPATCSSPPLPPDASSLSPLAGISRK